MKRPLPPPKLSDHIRLYASGFAALIPFVAIVLLAACAAYQKDHPEDWPKFPIANPYVR